MSTKRKIIEYAFITLAIAAAVAGVGFSLQSLGVTSWVVVVVGIAAGLILGTFCYTMIHELGHLIGGSLGGFKFYSFKVLMFKFVKINGKIKIRLAKSREFVGYCQMTPPADADLKKSFKKFVKGSKYASVIFLTMVFYCIFAPIISDMFADNTFLYCCVAGMFFPSFFIHALNFFTISNNPTTDGAILRGLKIGSNFTQTQIRMVAIQSKLFSGVRPKDLELDLFKNLDFDSQTEIYAPLFESYKLSHYLDCGAIENVIKCSDFIKSTYKNAQEVFHELLLCDVFFTELVYKNNIAKAETIYYQIARFIASHEDVSTLRIRMAKEIFIDGAYMKSLQTQVQAKDLAPYYEAQGGAVMECNLINELAIIAGEKLSNQN